jgi:hypothetical protein
MQTLFGLSLPPVACGRAMLYLFHFVCLRHVAAPPARMTVDVLMLMEITSVFVLMDLMVQNVKVTKTQNSCFMMEY